MFRIVGGAATVLLVAGVIVCVLVFSDRGDETKTNAVKASSPTAPAQKVLTTDNLLTTADVPGAIGEAEVYIFDRDTIDCETIDLEREADGGCARPDGGSHIPQPLWMLVGNAACAAPPSLPVPTHLGSSWVEFPVRDRMYVSEGVLAFESPADAQRWMPKVEASGDLPLKTLMAYCPPPNSDGEYSPSALVFESAESCDLADECIVVVDPDFARRYLVARIGNLLLLIGMGDSNNALSACITEECTSTTTTLPTPTRAEVESVAERALELLRLAHPRTPP